MGSKYATDAADQKNPPVCYSEEQEDKRNKDGDYTDLQMEVHLIYNVGSGVQLHWDVTGTMIYHVLDDSWLYGPTARNPSLLCEWEIHPDQLHGQFTIQAWYNGVLVLTAPSGWVPLESRDPIDSGLTRYSLIGSTDQILFQVTG